MVYANTDDLKRVFGTCLVAEAQQSAVNPLGIRHAMSVLSLFEDGRPGRV
jgi:hypothetical protein